MSQELRECLRARRFCASVLLHTTCNRSCCNWRASCVVTKHEEKKHLSIWDSNSFLSKIPKILPSRDLSLSQVSFDLSLSQWNRFGTASKPVPCANTTWYRHSVCPKPFQAAASHSAAWAAAFFSITQAAEGHCRHFDVFAFLLYFKWSELNVWSV